MLGKTAPASLCSLEETQKVSPAPRTLNQGLTLMSPPGKDSSAPSPTDAQITARVLAGEANAFQILIERHQAHVLRVVSGKVPREAELEVAQDAFSRAFTSLGTYDPTRPWRNWLTGIAVRACSDYWRERRWQREVPQSSLSEAEQVWLEKRAQEGSWPASGGESSPEAQVEARQVLAWALEHLAPRDRLVLILIHVEEYSVAEAAAMLGWGRSKVKVRAFRARQKLRAVLAEALSSQ